MPKKRNSSNSSESVDKKQRQLSTESPVFTTGEKEDQKEGMGDTDTLAIILQKLECLPDIQRDIKDIKSTIGDLKESIEDTQQDIIEINEKLHNQEKKIESMEMKFEEIQELKLENRKLKEDLEALQAYGRRENLVFLNIPEQTGENCRDVLNNFLKSTKLNLQEEIKFQRVHRLGPANSKGGPRPIIARFLFYPDREKIWSMRSNLKGTQYIIKEDFPADTERKRRSLYPVLRRAKDLKKKASMKNDKLVIDGTAYTVDTVGGIAESLHMREVSEMQHENFHLFTGQYSPFSNFAKSPFTLHGTTYSSNEQYFQSEKAKFAGDNVAYRKIMSAVNPSDIKFLGSQVNVDKKKWAVVSKQVMESGVTAKFSQNKNLKEILLETGKVRLV